MNRMTLFIATVLSTAWTTIGHAEPLSVTYGLNARYNAGTISAEFVVKGPGMTKSFESYYVNLNWESLSGDPHMVAAKMDQALRDGKVSLKWVKDALSNPFLKDNFESLEASRQLKDITLERYSVTYGLNARYYAGNVGAEFVITGPGMTKSFHSSYITLDGQPIQGDPELVAEKLQQALNEKTMTLTQATKILSDPFLKDRLEKVASMKVLSQTKLKRYSVGFKLNARYDARNASAEFVITGPGLKKTLRSYTVSVHQNSREGDPHLVASELERQLNADEISIDHAKKFLANPWLRDNLHLPLRTCSVLFGP